MVEVIAQAQQEAFVRNKLLRSLSDNGLTLQSLESHALKTGGQVEVNAVVLALSQQDSRLESLVGELALAPYVSAVSWSVCDELS
jgi:putative Mg2+ transporter-C (MgtC) family protein